MFMMIIANVLGFFLFLFLFWKSLKDDYQYERIFNLASLSLLGMMIGILTSHFTKSSYWFWIDLIGISLGFAFGLFKLRLKFYESFEGLVIGLLSWISLIYLSISIDNLSLSAFILFWISAVCVAMFYFLKSYYRTFSWYKSGRVGFAGVLTTAIYFLIRAISNNDPYMSASVAILFFLLLYVLSTHYEK